MNKVETVTIALSSDMMDIIRKAALKDYRSINKQIAYLLNQAIKAESTGQ
jgi:hypothetical protein